MLTKANERGYKMKNYKITVNGKEYEVQVEDMNTSSSYKAAPSLGADSKPAPKTQAAPAAAAAAAAPKVPAAPKAAAPAGSGSVVAPLPGTILSIAVKEGDAVKPGQILLILEAMKMENEIVAAKAGTVTNIATNVGVAVNTGDLLVEIS